MGSGIRAEVCVDPAGSCAVAEAARSVEAPARSVSRVHTPGRVTEEFTLESSDVPDVDIDADTDLSRVFDYGATAVYRLDRRPRAACPCDVVERFDTPVADARCRNGRLRLVFHATDVAELQEIIGALREAFPAVDVRRLLRSDHEQPDEELLFVDRGRLTDRQREVLETAHRMGYFDHPKGANAGEVAAELDISRSTFAEHLAAAQSKLLDAVLDA